MTQTELVERLRYAIWRNTGCSDDAAIQAAEAVAECLEPASRSPIASDGLVEALKYALVQAAVPLEALLLSREYVDLSDTSWGEIENGVKHIRQALASRPASPQPSERELRIVSWLREMKSHWRDAAKSARTDTTYLRCMTRADNCGALATAIERRDHLSDHLPKPTAEGERNGG